MTNDEFRYWIDGYLTLTSEVYIDAPQCSIILNHANLVKAMMGSLDSINSHFITWLNCQIKCNDLISVEDLSARLRKR